VRRSLAAADEERWRDYLGNDDLDEPAEVVFYCRECADEQFGNSSRT
jgi:hypothetical protein